MIVRHDYLFLPLFTSFGTLRSFPSSRFGLHMSARAFPCEPFVPVVESESRPGPLDPCQTCLQTTTGASTLAVSNRQR
jgi:hypothetical protein